MHQYFIPFLWLINIPLSGYITLCLFIHQLMDLWVVSTFWLLWTVSSIFFLKNIQTADIQDWGWLSRKDWSRLSDLFSPFIFQVRAVRKAKWLVQEYVLAESRQRCWESGCWGSNPGSITYCWASWATHLICHCPSVLICKLGATVERTSSGGCGDQKGTWLQEVSSRQLWANKITLLFIP